MASLTRPPTTSRSLSVWLLAVALLNAGTVSAVVGDRPRPAPIAGVVLHSIAGPQCVDTSAIRNAGRGGKTVPCRAPQCEFSPGAGSAGLWARFFSRRSVREGIHYIVDKRGRVATSTHESLIAGHAGAKHNPLTVGIELVNRGRYKPKRGNKFRWDTYPDDQIDALVDLLVELRERNPEVTLESIRMHSDIDRRAFRCGRSPKRYKRKVDPGPEFPYAEVIRRVACAERVASANGDGDPLVVDGRGLLSMSGEKGGPFQPGSLKVEVTNCGDEPMQVMAKDNRKWLTVKPRRLRLDAGETRVVEVSTTRRATKLRAGTFGGLIELTGDASPEGTTRRARLTVRPRPTLDLRVKNSVCKTIPNDPVFGRSRITISGTARGPVGARLTTPSGVLRGSVCNAWSARSRCRRGANDSPRTAWTLRVPGVIGPQFFDLTLSSGVRTEPVYFSQVNVTCPDPEDDDDSGRGSGSGGGGGGDSGTCPPDAALCR